MRADSVPRCQHGKAHELMMHIESSITTLNHMTYLECENERVFKKDLGKRGYS